MNQGAEQGGTPRSWSYVLAASVRSPASGASGSLVLAARNVARRRRRLRTAPEPPGSPRSAGGVVERFRCEVHHTVDRGPVHPGCRIGGSGRLLRWRKELREGLGERLGMGERGDVPGAGDLLDLCAGEVVGHVLRGVDGHGLGVRSVQDQHRS